MIRAIPCVAVLALTIAAGSGCVARTSPITLGPEPGVLYDETKVRQVEGRGCGFTLSGIPVTTDEVYERAYDDLRREAPFEYLGEIEAQPYWRYAVIGVFHCVRLVASAYEIPETGEPARSPRESTSAEPELEPEPEAGAGGTTVAEPDAGLEPTETGEPVVPAP